MKKTNFYDIHNKLGAKIVSFAGYEMPIQYPKGIIGEHHAVRKSVGMFDVSHMGEFEVKGSEALEFVQQLTINDASKLAPGKAQYSAMCYDNGGIVDDLLVYRLDEGYMLVVNASNIEKDFDWAKKTAEKFDVELKNISDEVNLLAVQGPKSLDTLNPIASIEMKEIPFYNYAVGDIAGVPMIISRTGYTGELGFELYFHGGKEEAEKVWNAVMDAGKPYDIEPVGLGCRDTLRLEKGYCLYGNDIDEKTNPIEAGLGWITKIDKGEFNGRTAIAKVKEQKPTRKLVAFVAKADKFIPRKGYKIALNLVKVGEVTSGNLSPTLNKPIGLGYVPFENKAPGTIVQIEARGRDFEAEIVKLPFVE